MKLRISTALAALLCGSMLLAQDAGKKATRDSAAGNSRANAAATTNVSAKTAGGNGTAPHNNTNGGSSAAVNGQPLDLNTATPEQIKALPGIGDAYTKRIIDGRPYSAKNQLVQRGIVPQKTYDGIQDKIIAKRPAASATKAAAPAARK